MLFDLLDVVSLVVLGLLVLEVGFVVAMDRSVVLLVVCELLLLLEALSDDEIVVDDFVCLDVVESVDVAVLVGEVLDTLPVLIAMDFVLL